MEKKPLISIVIPCYNDDLYVEQAVNSAFNQSYINKEIILVDDGSDQKTKEILNKLKPKLTTLISQENKGQSAARNAGIKEANGELIFVLDSDDFVEPTFCEKAINAFVNNYSIKIVTCYANRVFENGISDNINPQGGDILDFLFKNCALGSVMFYKKDWEMVFGYDENMTFGWEDWEFYIRLLKDGGNAYVIKETLFNYRARKNTTTAIANKNQYTLHKYIIFKHKKLYNKHFELTISFLLKLAENNKINEQKRINSLEFRIGKALLFPFRKIKRFFKFKRKFIGN
jgi:glycosyltransferase involved in cell wall biosynthesis